METKRKGKAIIGILMAAIMIVSVLVAMIGSAGAHGVGGEYNIIEKDDGGAIRIEADTTSTVELQTVKLTVTGVAGDEIKVEGENVIFKRGVDDTPTEINVTAEAPWFKDTIDKDGNRTYAVEFNDTGIYMIRVDVTGPAIIDGISNPRIGDYETVEISVSEKSVAFDVPPIAIIGDKITIRGTANSGTYISVFVDDNLYSQLCNLVIEDGEFSKEVRTTDIGMWRFDIAELKAYIDCNKRPGEDRPSRSPDGATKVFMVLPWLTASLSTDSVDQEGNFIVYGIAPGSTEVTLLSVPPRGGVGKSLLDKDMKGLSPRKASVSRTDYTYSKKMTVQEDATTGYYDEYVLTPGMDGYWGMTGEKDLAAAFEKKYGITDLSGPSIATKTQTEIQDILEDMTYAPGSDDLMVKLRLKVGDIDSQRPGEDRPSRSPDGATKVFMVLPWLTASLSTDSVDQEGDFIVYGTAPGSTEVTLLYVPPRGGGGKSLLDKDMKGLSPRKASVSTTDYTYSRKMTVQEDATTGYYDEYVLTAGMDGYWGMTGEQDLDAAFEKKYGITDLSGPFIATKTQTEIQDILEDMFYAPGSDDLMVKLRLKVGDIDSLTLNPIADVVVGDPLVVRGETSRKDDSIIWITVKKLYYEIAPQAAIATDNTFIATFDTTGAQPGTYTVNANDGYGYTTSTRVNIIAGAPP